MPGRRGSRELSAAEILKRNKYGFTLGADPEFEWWRGDEFVPASDVCCDKDLGTDGHSDTGEIRPEWGQPKNLLISINRLIERAAKEHDGLTIKAGSGTRQSLGGHIHFGNIPENRELVRALDNFIAIPLREISNHRLRERQHYGHLGAVRSQPHGWEYRSPASWISHPWIARGVVWIAFLLAKASREHVLDTIVDVKSLKRYGNKQENRNISHYLTLFYRTINNMKKNNIRLEQVEVFAAWKKRPRESRQYTYIPKSTLPQVNEIVADVTREIGITGQITLVVAGRKSDDGGIPTLMIPPSISTVPAMPPGVTAEIWYHDSVGLSKALYLNPDLAKKALIALSKMVSQKDILDKIEAKG